MPRTSGGGSIWGKLTRIIKDLKPKTDDTYDLGSSSKRWAYLYAVIAMVTSITIGGAYLTWNSSGYLFVNASTLINASLNVTDNVTADHYFGDGSELSNLPFNESFNASYVSSNYVPYSGASSNVNLGASYYLSADAVYADKIGNVAQAKFITMDTNPMVVNGSYFKTTEGFVADLYYASNAATWINTSVTPWILNTGLIASGGFCNSTNCYNITDFFDDTDTDTTYTNDSFALNAIPQTDLINFTDNLTQGDNIYHCFGDDSCSDGYIVWNGSGLLMKVS